MKITCNGVPFNECRGMTEADVRAAFEMYAEPRPKSTYTFALVADDGRQVASVNSGTAIGRSAAK